MKVLNIDTVVIAEAPKLGPYKDEMKRLIAKAFEINSSQVAVKAKTHEGIGELGKNKAIACYAVVTLGN